MAKRKHKVKLCKILHSPTLAQLYLSLGATLHFKFASSSSCRSYFILLLYVKFICFIFYKPVKGFSTVSKLYIFAPRDNASRHFSTFLLKKLFETLSRTLTFVVHSQKRHRLVASCQFYWLVATC